MKLKKSLQLALNTLIHNKLRSWLTIVGIVIGIAAVVSIISVSEGAKKNLESQLGSFGADLLTINPGFSRATGASNNFRNGGLGGESNSAAASFKIKNLTTKDITVIRNVQNIKYVMGTVSGKADITYLSKTASANVRGVDPFIWKDFVSTELSSGRYLTQGDTYAIVVGGRLANKVFEGEIQLNRQLSIEGKAFKIVGILKEGGNNDDSIIFIPISVARDILDNVGNNDFNSISVKIINTDLTDDTITQIEKKLMMARGILQDKGKDFSVTSPRAFQERITTTLNSMSLFLAAIAAISLIVGAVGISNTMFTSVLEKTKEIGIMKAIGAKNRDILMIFLLNSGLLGLVGGIGGVILGVLGSSLISSLSDTSSASIGRLSLSSTYFSPQLIIGAFLLSMIIGMIAGVIPAYRASRLKPVDALRYE